METKAYHYHNGNESDMRDVLITTEHPLSSYGQPVILEADGTATPAMAWRKGRLFPLPVERSDEEDALRKKANDLYFDAAMREAKADSEVRAQTKEWGW